MFQPKLQAIEGTGGGACIRMITTIGFYFMPSSFSLSDEL
jgi:hypothetical protein